MRKVFIVLIFLALVSIIIFAVAYRDFADRTGPESQSPEINQERLAQTLNKMSLTFVENQGQYDSDVKFSVKAGGQTIFFTPAEVVYSIIQVDKDSEEAPDGLPGEAEKKEVTGGVIRQKFISASSGLSIIGENELETKVNFFIGNDPDQWQSKVKTYKNISYQDLYDGVDLVFYGTGSSLLYQYLINPDKDYRQIQIELAGVNKIYVLEAGELAIETDFGFFKQPRPRAYNEINGIEEEVNVSYLILSDNSYSFIVTDYNDSELLIIEADL